MARVDKDNFSGLKIQLFIWSSHMLKVGQLLKFVSDLNPQKTPARLSFFNFLKGFANPEDALSGELLELYFNYSMDYPHWASNKVQLGHEVQFLLDNFNSLYQQKFDVSGVRFPQNMQIIELENKTDFLDAVSCYMRKSIPESSKFRVLNDQNKRAVVIVLNEDKSLEVRTFDKKFTIRAGEMEPLRKDLVLHYTPELELSPLHLHKIDVAPYITAQFTISGDRVTGQMIRGYVYQKLLEMKSEPLRDQARLLLPIQRLEQFFVDRSSDTAYQELTEELERTCALIQQGDREAFRWGSMLLSRAETALDNVFIGDKLLTLLVRDLRHALSVSNNPSEVQEECLKITPLKGYDLTN